MNMNMNTKKAKGEQIVDQSGEKKHLKSAGDCETKT